MAVDALRGPQAEWNGRRLVGRVPSSLEGECGAHTSAYGHDLRYSPYADPGSGTLGLVLCARRAGDVVLGRPVGGASHRAAACCDVTEGRVPSEEWQSRLW
ncbi:MULTISPECIES: hypothetical protein [unclassified Streptomyces]|uniref:hypothetical protein n=1 Tax=unclassified Streptomyces TaxID=2593676 RepID=UPI001D04DD94|nr:MULTISPECIES: hypothetical protein [unclassified Streptomyces]